MVTEGEGAERSVVRRLLEARMNLGGSVRVNPVGVAVITAIVLLLIFFNSGGSTKASVNTVNLKQVTGTICGKASGWSFFLDPSPAY